MVFAGRWSREGLWDDAGYRQWRMWQAWRWNLWTDLHQHRRQLPLRLSPELRAYQRRHHVQGYVHTHTGVRIIVETITYGDASRSNTEAYIITDLHKPLVYWEFNFQHPLNNNKILWNHDQLCQFCQIIIFGPVLVKSTDHIGSR